MRRKAHERRKRLIPRQLSLIHIFVKVKIRQEQMTLLRLKSAITDLSDELDDSTKKPVSYTHLDVYKRQPLYWR